MGAVNGSIINGDNPMHDPLALFILQILVIIILTRLLGMLLGYFRQPRVIAEVIGGILLGPSALGRIPGFSSNMFPVWSLDTLSNVANLGLIFYLFVVGLELDLSTLRKQLKNSLSISATGIILPFGLGIAVSVGLYNNLLDTHKPSFAAFMLFIGVAISITAFPVLARILTELKLLDSGIGVATIGAAAVDDAVAWCLLALVMAIVNNTGNPISALYVFLVTFAYALFCLFLVRPQLKKLINYTSNRGSLSHLMVFLMFVMVLTSAWFTQIIGVHAIFGAFIIGVITPSDNDFAIKITESIEDFVTILLLPIYFANSGLKTDITKMNGGTVWGYFFLVLLVACGGKLIGCTIAARLNGYKWRDASTIGALMNCKGLVELIVLNLGLSAGVINVSIFTMMVLMALATTFMTVPLVTLLYKPAAGVETKDMVERTLTTQPEKQSNNELGLLVTVKNSRSVTSSMGIIQLFGSSSLYTLRVNALRLVELSHRESTVMRAKAIEGSTKYDPLLNVFRMFGRIAKVAVSGEIIVAHSYAFSQMVVKHAARSQANLILVSWIPPSETSVGSAAKDNANDLTTSSHVSAFSNSVDVSHASLSNSSFIDEVLATSSCSVGVLIDRGFELDCGNIGANSVVSSPMTKDDALQFSSRKQRIVFPFMGGADDREALCMLMYICDNRPDLEVMVIRLVQGSKQSEHEDDTPVVNKPLRAMTSDTVVSQENVVTLEMNVNSKDSEEDRPGSSNVTIMTDSSSIDSVQVSRKNLGSVLDFSIDDDDVMIEKFKRHVSGMAIHFEEVIVEDLMTGCVNKVLATCGNRDLVMLGYEWYRSSQSLQASGKNILSKPSFSLLGNAANATSSIISNRSISHPGRSAESGDKHSLEKFINCYCVCSALIVKKHAENSVC